jgi:hypothetical protein
MPPYKFFLLLTAILLTGCGANKPLTLTPISYKGSTPTQEYQPLTEETALSTTMPTLMPTTPTENEDSSQPDANVTFVRVILNVDGTWIFHVTVEHPDTGWDDYADGWDVVTPDGSVLKLNPDDPFTRLLLHPHVGEQPFTRSQSGITIPHGISKVRVRAHDIVDGFGGEEILVDLEKDTGLGFKVER